MKHEFVPPQFNLHRRKSSIKIYIRYIIKKHKKREKSIDMNFINFEFRNEVLKHNSFLSYCYQCSTYSGGCPIALITNGKYNPRKIIEEAILGFQDKLVESQEPNPWLCSTYQKCVELCPQKVELTEIFTLMKNRCYENHKYPQAFLFESINFTV